MRLPTIELLAKLTAMKSAAESLCDALLGAGAETVTVEVHLHYRELKNAIKMVNELLHKEDAP